MKEGNKSTFILFMPLKIKNRYTCVMMRDGKSLY